ncbi:SH3 domain-containing protein [Streptomyces sp. NPDC002589]|uniref:SH3 domain-containing protein n=1 Tax=Streptomyces sp. NPDC002589 TaxID=3154420 RepID=UPI00331FE4A4
MNTLTRRAATVATAGTLLLGGAIATASTASAASTVGGGACTQKVQIHSWVETASALKIRTGPGAGYSATGQLSQMTGVWWSCNKGSWAYVKVERGAHKGEWGWVANQYLAVPMQTD